MRLNNVIDEAHKKFDEGEYLELNSIRRGKEFIYRLQKDLILIRSLQDAFGFSLDKRNWLSSELFPVTVEVINREPAPGAQVHVGYGKMQICVVYYGICPELENFVAIVLWPKESKTSKLTYQKIYKLISEDTKKEKVIRFQKGYGLKLPNELHPFRDKDIDSISKSKAVYEWEYVPYLKDMGNTILSHKSPVNFRKVFIEDEARFTTYLNLKSTIGTLLSLRKDEITVRIPSFEDRDRIFTARISPKIFSFLRKTERSSIYYLQVSEIANDNIFPYVRDFSLAYPIDVLASLLNFLLYVIHLGLSRLRLISIRTYWDLFNLCFKKTLSFCKIPNGIGFQLWTPENVFNAFLSPFFRQIHDHIFYVPFFLYRENDEIIELYDQSLAKRKSTLTDDQQLLFNSKGKLLNLHKLNASYRVLRFLIELKKMLWWSAQHEFIFQKLTEIAKLRESRNL
jgi:hypothetical protein